jgi:hypothetical protein
MLDRAETMQSGVLRQGQEVAGVYQLSLTPQLLFAVRQLAVYTEERRDTIAKTARRPIACLAILP